MKGLTVKLACIFIIAMYCLAPLGAAEVYAEHNNTKYISHGIDGSDIKVKDVNGTGDKKDDQSKKTDGKDNQTKTDGNKDKKTDSDKDKQTKNNDDVKDKTEEKASKDENVTWKKESPNLRINVKDSNGGDALAEITAKKSFSGTVLVYLKDYPIPEEVFVKDGHGKTEFKNLSPGRYSATVKYIGDWRFTPDMASTSFKIAKDDPALRIQVDDVKEGQKATAVITAKKSFKGHVAVYVKGNPIPQKVLVKDGSAKVSLGVLKPGDHEATVKFNGDEKFSPSEASSSFHVGCHDPALKVHVDDIYVGKMATVKITAKQDLSGKVLVYLDDKPTPQEVPIKNGYAETTIYGATESKHIVTVKFNGDDKYSPSQASASYNVKRANPDLKINVDNVHAGEKATAVIIAKEDFNGEVTVYLKGNPMPQKVLVKDGYGKAAFEGLAPGNYTATVKFTGDRKFEPCEDSTVFNVDKHNPALRIDVDDVSYGHKAIAKITANKDFSGNVSVYVKGDNIPQKVLVKDGNAKVSLGALDAGEHMATVKFNGDDKYSQSIASTTFKVKNCDPSLRINVNDVTYGHKAIAEITGKKSFTGNVSVYIKGNPIPQKVLVVNGHGQAILSGLSVGKHMATVKFDGNDKFSPCKASTSFNVKKCDPSLRISVDDVSYGHKATAKITAKKAFTGNVTVYIKGNPIPQKVLVKDGYGNASFAGLSAGKHMATVKFTGDDSFEASKASTSFNVKKCDPSLRVNVNDVAEGKVAIAEITAKKSYSGNVTVYLKGTSIPQKVFVEDGHANVSLGVLAPGKHMVTVKSAGNDNFAPAKASTSFNVGKANPSLRIDVDNITVGEDATAVITAKESFTGNVSLYVKGNPIPQKVAVVNGHGQATLSGLAAGEHIATAKFIGDKKFAPGVASTTFKVSKVNPGFSIKVDDITEGQKAVAHITANKSLNGEANVKLNNSNAVYPVSIVNGSGSVEIADNLSAGQYLATVTFNGDDSFEADQNSTSFNVEKVPELIDPKLNIKVKDISYGNKATVSISTDAGFSGNVGVDIGSKHINVKVVKGKGTVKVSGLATGTHTAKATFKQTQKYKASTKTAKFTVNKASVKLTAKSKTFKYFQKTKKYSVSLKNSHGKALKGKKVTLKVNGKRYFAKTNSKGVATFKLSKLRKVGSKKAVITFAGDKNYKKLSKKARITVKFGVIGAGSKNHLFIKKIQKALKKHHLYIRFNGHHLVVDGWFSTYTKMAVKEFQKAFGLKVTGKVNYKTALKLGIILGRF